MSSTSYRKCPECGTVNLNRDHCKACGALINTHLIREKEQRDRNAEKIKKEVPDKPNAVTLFFERATDHPNFLIRTFALIFQSIWMVVIAIGTFLAFLFAYVAA